MVMCDFGVFVKGLGLFFNCFFLSGVMVFGTSL